MPTEKGRYLDSWKEIAAYLNRNVRTCWLWERESAADPSRSADSTLGGGNYRS